MVYWGQYMQKIKEWLDGTKYSGGKLEIASADASFRQYFRLTLNDKNFIVMDASREKESLKPFMHITSKLLNADVKAPTILESDKQNGFLLIEDFGNTHYLNVLNEDNFKHLYSLAIDEIVKMQRIDATDLPAYNREFLRFEMDLMNEWFLFKYLNISLTEKQKNELDNALELIEDVVLSQPQNIFVHRDYHSRNLMLTPEKSIGIIDYQDAMSGALTYDLVSLLKDCYIEFEAEDINSLALQFRDLTKTDIDDETFLKWFDFMGLQRHIKVLGVFARLHIRDGKSNYLDDLPQTLKYVCESAKKYEELDGLNKLLEKITL